MRRALICGVSGQDGSYLADLLLAKGYHVTGTGRAQSASQSPEHGDSARFAFRALDVNDQKEVATLIEEVGPHEIYALAGQSSVARSFVEPVETLSSIVGGTLNLLEAVRSVDNAIRFYHAGSSETFGNLRGRPATEGTALHPLSPYAVAKASAHMLVRTYRESYGLFAANGILFNHESPRRPAWFVTRKITSAAARIAHGSGETLHLGQLDIVRDWGWAPEYVDAMWRILQCDEPMDFVIATGHSTRLEDFVAAAFAHFNLDWRDHVVSDPQLMRPSDLSWSGADPTRAGDRLGWRATVHMPQVAKAMAAAETTAELPGQAPA